MNDYNLTDYTLCERDYKLLIDAIKDEIQLLSTLIEHTQLISNLIEHTNEECDSLEVENNIENHPLILLRSEYEDLLNNLNQQNYLRS